jgi:metacaspase-1
MNVALLAGINDYDQSPLQGCLNDVENMRKLLTECCGFSVMSIKTLKNEQSTKERILKELDFMVRNAQEGDHLVFHFSGHGSQVPDTSGDETDGMDEILCPYDFGWRSEHYIADDELRSICSGLADGATLDVILDSCHSGTGLREMDGTPKCIPYPGPMPIKMPVPRGILQDHDYPNVALWAGCRSDQTSADAYINNQHQGAMTWAFCQAVSKWNKDRHHVNLSIGYYLEHHGYEQVPQLEACQEMRNREIFT